MVKKSTQPKQMEKGIVTQRILLLMEVSHTKGKRYELCKNIFPDDLIKN